MDITLSRLKYAKDLNQKILSILKTPEAIDDLAEKELIPHYRLANPITKETVYLYLVDEIEIYILRGMHQIIPKPLTIIKIVGDEDDSLPTKDIPKELRAYENEVYEIPIPELVGVSGVYFLYDGDELVYIGQSKSVKSRIMTHIAERRKTFNRGYFMRVHRQNLSSVETELIKHFNPRYNLT